MITNFTLVLYSIYLPMTILLTFFTAHRLFKNSKVFMLDIFYGKEEIAIATNRLFELGFYLLNVGFALWFLSSHTIDTKTQLVEVASVKIGGFTIYLGVVMIIHLVLFLKGRKRAKQNMNHLLEKPNS